MAKKLPKDKQTFKQKFQATITLVAEGGEGFMTEVLERWLQSELCDWYLGKVNVNHTIEIKPLKKLTR